MISKMISAVLVAAILQGSIAAQDQARSQQQTITTMQHFLRKAQEKNKAVKVTLNKKINNQRKVSGGVSGISDTGFVIDDEKTGTATTVAYSDVREVSYKGLSTATQIVIVTGVVVGVLVVIAAAVVPKT
jgi:hypothetical protein